MACFLNRSIALGILILLLIVPVTAGANNAPPEKVDVIIGFEGKPDAALVHAFDGEIKYEYHIISAIACRLPEQAIDALQNNPRIAYIEPDILVHVTEDQLPWGVDRIEAEEVWNPGGYPDIVQSPAGESVLVAVIDTGVDKDHPDLLGNIYVLSRNFESWYGTGLFCDPEKFDDDHGHGTHVAGIIAAIDNNDGVIGTAPLTNILVLKALSADGSGFLSDIIRAIEYAVDCNADIISMSFGTALGSPEPVSLGQACQNAYDAGVLLIASAGNEGTEDGSGDTVSYPARYPSVIAVAAVDSSMSRAYFSGTGDAVELAAPGVGIPSTFLDGGYKIWSGTSMACPHVSGVAALVMQADKNSGDVSLSNADVRTLLHETAEDLGNPLWYGSGLVRADWAVANVTGEANPDQCPDDPLKTDPGICGCGIPDTDSDGDGTPDCNDICPADQDKTDPGICGCGIPDIDSEGDGTPDCNDQCPYDPNKTIPGTCGCGVADIDSDGDGTPDCNDLCPADQDKTDPGICGCGIPDIDSDGDGTPDCNDLCPADQDKTDPGICGCGVAETDTDGDGTPDCNDQCPVDPLKTEPGTCGCSVADTDSDGDGTPDCSDKCPDDPYHTDSPCCIWSSSKACCGNGIREPGENKKTCLIDL